MFNVKEKVKGIFKEVKENPKLVAFSTALCVPVMAWAEPTGRLINTSGVDFMKVLDEMVALVPVVLPTIIGCLAFRKGFSFIKSAIKGA